MCFNKIINKLLLFTLFQRILDEIIDDIGGPLSDHYGVEVSLVKDDATP